MQLSDAARAPEQKRIAIEAWLARHMPRASDLSVRTISSTGGLSHEILDLDVIWREDGRSRHQGMMIRIDPVHYRKRKESNLRREFDVLSVMHDRRDIPVPEPFWFEADANVLGAPFYAMERVDGRAVLDQPPYQIEGWLHDLPAGDRAQCWRSAVTTLGRLHAAPAEALAVIRREEDGRSDFDQHLDYWHDHYEWALGKGTNPVTDAAWEWLYANPPSNRPAGLAWGDARYVNFLFQGLSCVAVLDWEDVALASPLFDLGRWFLTQRLHDAWELPRLDGLGDRQQTLALWEICSGLSATDLEWYELFNAACATAIAQRMFDLKAKAMEGRSAPPKFTTEVLDTIVLELMR